MATKKPVEKKEEQEEKLAKNVALRNLQFKGKKIEKGSKVSAPESELKELREKGLIS